MTAAARISQADMDRALKAVKAAAFDRARVVMDLENSRIEIIIGESGGEISSIDPEWSDDDV